MPKEVRTCQVNDFRAALENDEMILEGYAAVFDKPTVLFSDGVNDYKEVIDKEAFKECDFRKCCLKYNHESTIPVLARVRGGSLQLSVDDYGLHFRAKLFNTQTSRDIYEIVKAGGIDECSFAFSIADDGSHYDKETHTRTLRKVETLWDCSVVDHPAYTDGTSVAARSFLEAEAEKERLESLEEQKVIEDRERKIKQIKLMLELNK